MTNKSSKSTKQNGVYGLYTVHVTDREGMALVEHCFQQQSGPKDHKEQMLLFDLFDKFGLMETWEKLRLARLTVDDFDANTFKIATGISESLIDHVLEVTNKPMAALHALILTPLIKRLKDVKMGTYVVPKLPDDGESDESDAKVS